MSLRLLSRTFASCVLILAAATCLAQTAAPRKTVGLVLGGGGARGSAHLGVLEILEEHRVRIDCVTGTSMGALVGGAYAAGVSPAEMREMIGKTDWNAIFDDSTGRDLVNLRRKQLDDRFYSGLEFGVGKDGLSYREGAIAGEKIRQFFNRLVSDELGTRTIESLSLPLTLMATDIGTGDRVAMRTGSLTQAMRASMSVPGVLAPVMRDGRKLVDGGLVDNVPIAEVQALCNPDVVIAINVGSPLLKPGEVAGVLSVVGQMVNLLAEQNVQNSLKLVRPQDIYLRPELGNLTAADFDRQIEGAEVGRKAALEVAERFRALSVPEGEYAAWRAKLRAIPAPRPPVIDEIRFADTRFVNRDAIRSGFRAQAGKVFDPDEISRDMEWIYSQGDMQSLDYSVIRERDKTILRVTPFEKPWGPDYLRFGINLSSDLRTDADYNVRALYRRTWLNAYGAEWLVAAQVGTEQVLATEFYQPLDFRQAWYMRPYLSFAGRKTGIYLDGNRLAEYRINNDQFGLEAGSNLGIYGQAKIGWRERKTDAELVTGSALFPSGGERVGGITAGLDLDTQDAPYFPSRGYRAKLNYFDARNTPSDIDPYSLFTVGGEFATTWRAFTFVGAADSGRTAKGDLPLSDVFALGGPRRLSAFAPNQILGNEYDYMRLEAQWRLTKPMPILGLDLIAGVLAERGRMNKRATELNLGGWLDSYGVYIAANTALGPIYFGYADGKKGNGRAYLFIGTP
jgi:NTE family protein